MFLPSLWEKTPTIHILGKQGELGIRPDEPTWAPGRCAALPVNSCLQSEAVRTAARASRGTRRKDTSVWAQALPVHGCRALGHAAAPPVPASPCRKCIPSSQSCYKKLMTFYVHTEKVLLKINAIHWNVLMWYIICHHLLKKGRTKHLFYCVQTEPPSAPTPSLTTAPQVPSSCAQMDSGVCPKHTQCPFPAPLAKILTAVQGTRKCFCPSINPAPTISTGRNLSIPWTLLCYFTKNTIFLLL